MKLLFFFLISFSVFAQMPLRIGIDGLTHDHISQVLNSHKRGDVEIVGIAEPNRELAKKYMKKYNLDENIWFSDLSEMVKGTKPEAVCAFNSIAKHLATVEVCAPLGIHIMVEKPLATNSRDAKRMQYLAQKHKVHLLTNYETTWYPSHTMAFDFLNDKKNIKKVLIKDGHSGPKEIGCSEEFLSWLTDPKENGGGAVIDFGCYGANLMTYFMKGERPKSVFAVLKQLKPEVYPKVDDEAIIILEYENASAVIEASWNWPYDRKDTEIFAENFALFANSKQLLIHENDRFSNYKEVPLLPLDKPYNDSFLYLNAVVKNKVNPAGSLSSLENNILVVEILEKAIISAKEGKKIPF
jgi:scyllo-inositol 2-dehydrogenase (NADP+)